MTVSYAGLRGRAGSQGRLISRGLACGRTITRMDDPLAVRRGRGRWRWSTAILGFVLLFFALAHSLEDFAYGVPEERFGLDSTLAAIALAVVFLLQGAVVAMTWRGWRIGYLGSLVVGVAWLVAAVLDHLGDLFEANFREGTSDVLILGLIVTSALVTLSAGWVLFRRVGGDEPAPPLIDLDETPRTFE